MTEANPEKSQKKLIGSDVIGWPRKQNTKQNMTSRTGVNSVMPELHLRMYCCVQQEGVPVEQQGKDEEDCNGQYNNTM